MRVRVLLGVLAVAFLASLQPVIAADATLAPADESFGRFNLSVLGIANSIRDSGTRLDNGTDPHDVIAGPLAFVTDAMHAWEARYPSDPWIAKDLLALEMVYLKIPTDEGLRLATRTEAWLVADFPQSAQGVRARALLADASPAVPAAPVMHDAPIMHDAPAPVVHEAPVMHVARAIPSYALPVSAWERDPSLRLQPSPR